MESYGAGFLVLLYVLSQLSLPDRFSRCLPLYKIGFPNFAPKSGRGIIWDANYEIWAAWQLRIHIIEEKPLAGSTLWIKKLNKQYSFLRSAL